MGINIARKHSMKILQINCVFNTSSTGKIVKDIHFELISRNIKSIVMYGHGERLQDINLKKITCLFLIKLNAIISRITGLMYSGCFSSTLYLQTLINREKPDIVHIHCVNGHIIHIPRFIIFLKKRKIKTILTLHAEFMHTANCGYALDCENWKTGCGNCPRLWKETKSFFFDNTALSWRLMKKAFEGFDEDLKVTSVSPWLMKRAKQSPILANKDHSVVLNGIDTEIFYYHQTSLKQELNLENYKIVLHVTASFTNSIKGGAFVVELARQMPETIFIVIGSAKPSPSYPANLVIIGRIEEQHRLAEYYSMAHVTVITSKRETFSMPCIESLCCGTPVVGFKAGGPEEISLPEYSTFIDYGNLNALKSNLQHYLSRSFSKIDISQQATRKYSKENMTKNYIKLYKVLLANVQR